MSKKDELLPLLAKYVLEQGLNASTLRPMAKAAGTSDRMLIYHFGSKDGVIKDTLAYLTAQMSEALDGLFGERTFNSEAELVQATLDIIRADMFRPFFYLWFDIVSAAARGSELHRDIGSQIVESYIEWIGHYHPQGRAAAAGALIKIDGAMILDAVGRRDVTTLALARGL